MRGFGLLVAFVGVAALAGCAKNSEPAAPAAPSPPASDRDRLQGVWAVESFDAGDPKLKLREDLTKLRFQFLGDRIGTGVPGKMIERSNFALNDSTDPKVMTVSYLDENGQPVKPTGGNLKAFPHDWLYKFDGDTLVLAKIDTAVFTEKAPERPKDFTPRPYKPGTPGVLIIRLKKTEETATEPPARPARGTRR